MKDSKDFCVVAIILVGVGMLLGLVIGFWINVNSDKHWQKQIVEHGAAEYDKATGQWKWIEPNAHQP